MVKTVEDKSLGYLSDEKAVRRFVRQMLKNHVFVGKYIEQRYVEEFNCYKKIVQISRNDDIFIENLSVVKRRLERFFAGTKWIGITFPNTPGAPMGFNLWVEMDEQILGTYKFRVKDVEFLDDQISLKLQITVMKDEEPISNDSSLESMKKNNSFRRFVSEDLTIGTPGVPIISWGNLKEVTIFMFLLLAAVVTGGGQILMFLMDYALKLIRELSNVIRVTTPIFIACFDTLSRMFGYICVLIAMLWRDRHSTPKGQVFYPQKIQYQAAYPYENRYKALTYEPKSSVRITELPE